jgi:hypothetical protein
MRRILVFVVFALAESDICQFQESRTCRCIKILVR